MINEVLTLLGKNPSMSVTLQGYTDSVGSDEYNMDLSLRRGKAIKAYLVGKGISSDRLATQGFGSTKPVSLNGTELGRSINKRVQIQP